MSVRRPPRELTEEELLRAARAGIAKAYQGAPVETKERTVYDAVAKRNGIYLVPPGNVVRLFPATEEASGYYRVNDRLFLKPNSEEKAAFLVASALRVNPKRPRSEATSGDAMGDVDEGAPRRAPTIETIARVTVQRLKRELPAEGDEDWRMHTIRLSHALLGLALE